MNVSTYTPSNFDKQLILLAKGHLINYKLPMKERLTLFFNNHYQHELSNPNDWFNIIFKCVHEVISNTKDKDNPYILIKLLGHMSTATTEFEIIVFGNNIKWDYNDSTLKMIECAMKYLQFVEVMDGEKVLIDLSGILPDE